MNGNGNERPIGRHFDELTEQEFDGGEPERSLEGGRNPSFVEPRSRHFRDGRVMAKLRHIPLTMSEANEFIERHHRHHGKLSFHKFSLGAVLGEKVVNACSFLYAAAARAAAARAAFALGFTAETET